MPWSAARATSAAGAAWPPMSTAVEATEGVDRVGVVEQGRELRRHEGGVALRDAQAAGRRDEGLGGEVVAVDRRPAAVSAAIERASTLSPAM